MKMTPIEIEATHDSSARAGIWQSGLLSRASCRGGVLSFRIYPMKNPNLGGPKFRTAARAMRDKLISLLPEGERERYGVMGADRASRGGRQALSI